MKPIVDLLVADVSDPDDLLDLRRLAYTLAESLHHAGQVAYGVDRKCSYSIYCRQRAPGIGDRVDLVHDLTENDEEPAVIEQALYVWDHATEPIAAMHYQRDMTAIARLN